MMKNYCSKLSLNGLREGLIRLSFLVAIGFAVWGAYIGSSPGWSSVGVYFSDEDRAQFKKYLSVEHPWMSEELKDEKADNILYYLYGSRSVTGGRILSIEKSRYGEREGKASVFAPHKFVKDALNRMIDEEKSMDFSGGHVVHNRAYGMFCMSDDDYSIVAGFKERLFTAVKLGVIFGLVSWIFVLLVSQILPLLLKGLRMGGFLLYRNLRWISQGFLRDCNE